MQSEQEIGSGISLPKPGKTTGLLNRWGTSGEEAVRIVRQGIPSGTSYCCYYRQLAETVRFVGRFVRFEPHQR